MSRELIKKYIITKADWTPVSSEADYFVLRLDTDPHARRAARAYAKSIRLENPQLANDIEDRCIKYWLASVEKEATCQAE